MTLDFQTNKRVCEEVAIIPSKSLKNKIAGYATVSGFPASTRTHGCRDGPDLSAHACSEPRSDCQCGSSTEAALLCGFCGRTHEAAAGAWPREGAAWERGKVGDSAHVPTRLA